ncbi:MAG: hypothetical protein LUD14_11195 [Clostridiales bacterium]|nr:hypothetical protein [Clostridiales bacterium]
MYCYTTNIPTLRNSSDGRDYSPIFRLESRGALEALSKIVDTINDAGSADSNLTIDEAVFKDLHTAIWQTFSLYAHTMNLKDDPRQVTETILEHGSLGFHALFDGYAAEEVNPFRSLKELNEIALDEASFDCDQYGSPDNLPDEEEPDSFDEEESDTENQPHPPNS